MTRHLIGWAVANLKQDPRTVGMSGWTLCGSSQCVLPRMACAGRVVISRLSVGACAWGFEAPAVAPGPHTSPCAALPGCLGDDTSLAVWDWAGERVPSYLDCCSGPASKCNGALTG